MVQTPQTHPIQLPEPETPDHLALVLLEPDQNPKRPKRMLVRYVWHRVFEGAYEVVAHIERDPEAVVRVERQGDWLVVTVQRGSQVTTYTSRRVRVYFKSLWHIEQQRKIYEDGKGCTLVFLSAYTVY